VVGLVFRFDLGRYHATPWGTHVNSGEVEWPPSSWRILRGLYAVSRANGSLTSVREPIDRALAALAAAPPPDYELPASVPAHTRHYFPSRDFSPTRSGKTDKVLDAFRAVDPSAELRVWWDTDIDGEERAALSATTEALGYLGRSESVCSAKLVDGDEPAEPDASPLTRWRGSADVELVELLCPQGLGALTASVDDLRRRRLLQPIGARLVEYAVCMPLLPALPEAPSVEPPTLALYRLGGRARPGIRDAVAVAEAVRAAVQGRYGAIHAGAASAVFSGRDENGFRRDDHRHAHYLALPDEQGRRVDYVAVWAPEGFGPDEIATLGGLRELRASWLREPLPVALAAVGRPAAIRFPRLLGPVRRWQSVTPFGLPRHPKARAGRLVEGPVEQIQSELTRRGYPAPEHIELVRGPWLEYRRTRVRVSRLRAAHVVGAEIVFSEPVRGPLAIGALSHFGLGLFQPAVGR